MFFLFLAHGWMGWKNGNKPVSLVFHFSGRKRFHAITLTLYVERDFGIQVSCPTFFSGLEIFGDGTPPNVEREKSEITDRNA